MQPGTRAEYLGALSFEEGSSLLCVMLLEECVAYLETLFMGDRAKMVTDMTPQQRLTYLAALPTEGRAAMLGALAPEERAEYFASLQLQDRELSDGEKQLVIFKEAFVEVYHKWLHADACLSLRGASTGGSPGTPQPRGTPNDTARELSIFKEAFTEMYRKWQHAEASLVQLSSPHVFIRGCVTGLATIPVQKSPLTVPELIQENAELRHFKYPNPSPNLDKPNLTPTVNLNLAQPYCCILFGSFQSNPNPNPNPNPTSNPNLTLTLARPNSMQVTNNLTLILTLNLLALTLSLESEP